MKDRNDFKKYGDIRVVYESVRERIRAGEILEERGFDVPAELKDPTKPSVSATNLLDINIRWKHLDYQVPTFICGCMGSSGVRLYSVPELERIAELKYRVVPRFPVFHVPHDGNRFPPELMASVCILEEEFRNYHEAMRDKHVVQLIPRVYRGGQMLQTFAVSRLLCDVERFIGPGEVMEQYGMGFCYEKAYDGKTIKKITEKLKEDTLKYYDEHHTKMNNLCERHPRILLFDMHSYYDKIVPKEYLTNNKSTPDLCIGTDERYTPSVLREIVVRRFTEVGLSVAENDPYSGCYIPDSVLDGSSACDLAGIMLEFHRRAYLDENGEVDPEKAEKIRQVIRQIMVDCVDLP